MLREYGALLAENFHELLQTGLPEHKSIIQQEIWFGDFDAEGQVGKDILNFDSQAIPRRG